MTRRFEIGLGLTTLAFVACRQVLGIESREEGAPPIPLGEACGACVATACDAAERACAADPKCVEAAACLAGAGLDNPTGRIACLSEHAQASIKPALRALDQCMRSPCQDACYGRAGYFAAYGDDCVGCTETECGDQMAECVRDPHCEGLAVDALADPRSVDPPALGRLLNAPGDAGEEERGMSECSFQCNERCGFDGKDLSCLGSYAWPLEVESGDASLELDVSAIVDTSGITVPVPGATYELCASAPCEVVASTTTDASGFGRVYTRLPYPQGFRGFGRLSGELGGEPLVTTHFFAYPILAGARGSAILVGRTVFEQAAAFAGGAIPGKAHLYIAALDCRARRAPNIVLELPPEKSADATLLYLNGEGATSDDGVVYIWNAEPGCYDIVGTSNGVETHRMRVQAEPDVVSEVFLVPKADPPDQGSSCTPD